MALWLYSGQSEVGYELFEFRPELQHCHSFPYVFGEGYGPVFTPDESLLALAWATNSSLLVDDWPQDGVTSVEQVVEWATLHVHSLQGETNSQCKILARLQPGSTIDSETAYYPTMTSSGSGFHLASEWGRTVEVSLPLPDALTIDGPPPSP